MISKIIASRRSVFPVQYNEDAISKAEISTILEAANWAPTHRKTEPWRFKVFHSEIAKKRLSEFAGEAYQKTAAQVSSVKLRTIIEKPIKSGCVIAICMQRDPKESVPEWEEIASVAMSVQNMWLMATEMKIGTYWSTPSFLKLFGDYFSLKEGERCIGLFYMGKYDGTLPEGERKTSIDQKTQWF